MTLLQRSTLCLLLLLAGAHPALAWDSPAPDVVLYCTPALEAPLRDIARRYTAASHVEVHLFVAPPDGLTGLIKHRARDDVVVGDTPTLNALAADHLVRPETLVGLGRNPFVLVGRPGAASAVAVVLPDPTTAASFDGAAVLRAAPLPADAPSIPAHAIGVSDTPEVESMVLRDDTLVGLVHMTEAHRPGLAVVAALGAPPTPTSGALVTNGQSANAAALLAFIAGPDGVQVLRSAGLEPGL